MTGGGRLGRGAAGREGTDRRVGRPRRRTNTARGGYAPPAGRALSKHARVNTNTIFIEFAVDNSAADFADVFDYVAPDLIDSDDRVWRIIRTSLCMEMDDGRTDGRTGGRADGRTDGC